jgi:hypothetical protein
MATSLLQNNGEVRVSCHNVDDLVDAIDRTGLECDIADPNGLETSYDLRGIRGQYASCHTEHFYRKALVVYLLPRGVRKRTGED